MSNVITFHRSTTGNIGGSISMAYPGDFRNVPRALGALSTDPEKVLTPVIATF